MGETIESKAQDLEQSLHYLKLFLLVVSTATTGYALSETALGWWGGYDYWLDWVVSIIAFAVAGFVDFLIINKVFSSGYYLWKKSRIEKDQRKEADFAYSLMLVIGIAGIGLSLSTSYLGSKMIGVKFTPKVDTKEIFEANREENQALAPYRTRRDSLEKALAKAIEYGASPWAKCAKDNAWCKGKVDSVATSQNKIFASKIKDAGVEIEKAQTNMAGTFAALRKVATSTTEARVEAEEAKVTSAHILVKMFGLASVILSVLIIIVMVNVELAVSTTPPSQTTPKRNAFTVLLTGGNAKNRQSPKSNGGNGGSPSPNQRGLKPNHSLLVGNDPTDGTMWP